MSNAVLISGSLVGTRELIAELGADPDLLAEQAGLAARLFEEPDIYVQADRIVDFFELAAIACHCPAFGLRHAERLPMGIFWQIWMVMRTAENVRAALDNYVRLYGLYTDGGSFNAELRGDGLWMNYALLPLGHFGSAQMVHLTLGRLCLFIAENLGRSWHPKRVLLTTEPEDVAPFVAFFGSGVAFGQQRNAVLIDHDTLRAPMAMGSLGRGMRPLLPIPSVAKGAAVVAQVRSLLSALLRHEHCAIETVAEALGLSGRTLQRRLTEAGTSYRELADAVRADLAWRHVQRTDLSIARVADLLGYDSQTAFSRAFRRWHGINPRAARSAPARALEPTTFAHE